LPVFRSPETHPIQSAVDLTNQLALFFAGLDLVGPFKKAKGGFAHIFVVVGKFTKWIEANSTTSIIAVKAMEFISEIMYWFGIPNNIITNDGTHFTTR
jgi:hypothetical protein